MYDYSFLTFYRFTQDGTLTLKEYMKLQQQKEDSPLEPGQFLQRLHVLELQVAANSDKLSRILELLEKQQKWFGWSVQSQVKD